jgi:predicted GNAT family acetyltransferase
MSDVVDNTSGNRFELTRDGHRAELVYETDGDKLVLVHTGVPRALAGQGIGGTLVQAALQHAARNGLTVVPLCPFARRWLERHADAVTGVTIDWTAPR